MATDLQSQYLSAINTGGGHYFSCKCCGASLMPSDRMWQHFSGHKKDCDAILAGIAIDWDVEQERLRLERYAAMTPEEKEREDSMRLVMDLMEKRLLDSWR